MGIISQNLGRCIPNVVPTEAERALADVLAFLHDGPGNHVGDYRPSWDGDAYEPTPEDDAWRLGFDLGLAGEPLPEHHDPALGHATVMARLRGWEAGSRERVDREWADRREWEAWLDSLGGPTPDWPDAEVIEARGVIRARSDS